MGACGSPESGGFAIWEQSPTPCHLPLGDVVLETEPRAACRVSGRLWLPSSSLLWDSPSSSALATEPLSSGI